MTTSMNTLHGILVLLISICLKLSTSERIVPSTINHRNLKDVIFPLSVTCHASGSDNKTYVWRLPDNSLRSTGSNSSYMPEMCGSHQCIVTNKAGTDISNIISVTACDSDHTVKETDIYKDKGKHLILPCTIPHGHPLSDLKKSWKKPTHQNEKNVYQTEDNTLIILRLDSSDLLDLSDRGLYVCQAFNSTARKKVDIVRYKVEISLTRNTDNRLELVYSSLDVITTEGTRASFTCIFSESNFSQPNSVFWTMNKGKEQTFIQGNETMIIDRVKVEDEGNITCSFRGLSHYLSLLVRALPKCSESFVNQNITRGQNIRNVCLKPQDLRPHIHLQWFINGSHLKEFDDLLELNFQNVTNSFVVTVNISNGLQNEFDSVYVMVQDATIPVSTTTFKTSTTNLPIPTTSTSPTTVTASTTPTTPTTPTTSTTSTTLTQPIPINIKIFITNSTTTNSTTTTTPSSDSSILIYIISCVVVAVIFVLIIPMTICCIKKRAESKRKQQQNSIAPRDRPLVLANVAMNNPPPRPSPPTPPPANNEQLVNQPPHRVIMADEDSMSLRSSDSGFSDPANEPLLKSNEQLNENNENKSKSNSESTLADQNDRSMMMSSVC